jgi:hypothetical protein
MLAISSGPQVEIHFSTHWLFYMKTLTGAKLVPVSTRILIVLTFGFACLCLNSRAAEPTPSGAPTLSGTAGMQRMQAARDEVANVRSNIFLTLVELDRVRGEHNPGGPHFQAFTNQLAVMEDLVKKFARRAEEMKQKGDAYFAEWEARSASQSAETRQRYADRKRSYDAINGFMQEARENFLSFFKDVTEIKTLLQGSRDQKSIAQAKQLGSQANWRSLDTQRALMNIEDEFDRLAESFAADPGAQKDKAPSQ